MRGQLLFEALVVTGLLFSLPAASLMTYTREPATAGVSAGWPEELKTLVRTDALVMAAEGPIADVRVYCAGDTSRLNAFLRDFAAISDAMLRVTLHPGRETCTYREGADAAGEVLAVDWLLHVREMIPGRPDAAEFGNKKLFITVDIWLGGNVELDKLQVPASLMLVSSGELEGFVERHHQQQAIMCENEGNEPAESAKAGKD